MPLGPVLRSVLGSALSPALGEGGGGRLLLDDHFSRYADDTVLSGTLPEIGTAWGTTGTSLPTTADGYAQILSAGTTGYLFNYMPETPFDISGLVSFTGAGAVTQAPVSITFAASSNPMTAEDILHLNFGPQSFDLTVRQAAGSFNSILSGKWVEPMSNDGVSHLIALAVDGEKVTILDPNGGYWSTTDSRVPSVVGTTAYWQPGHTTDGLVTRFARASAKAQGPALRYNPGAPWNPSDLTFMTLSNRNFTATAGSGSRPHVRTVAANSRSKVYFEIRNVQVFNASSALRSFGISNASHSLAQSLGSDADSAGWWISSSAGFRVNSIETTVATGGAMQVATGDFLGFAFDFDLQKSWCRNITKGTGWNNDTLDNQDPANGVGGQSFAAIGAGPYYITFQLSQLSDSFILSTGQMPFAGEVPSGFGNW